MKEIANWASTRGDIDIIETHNLLCSPDGKKFFREKLETMGSNRIVIAGCSPKMHEKTFQKITEDAGINLSRVHLANIREQCAWVTKDKEEATLKAKHLISASIRRINFHEDLARRSMKCLTDIMIVGGGIAGIEAAITASKAGRKVYIVEKDISIGGNIIKSEEVAPNMECAPCLLAPRLSDIRDDPNITVISNAEVEEILGFYGNFTARITKKPRYIKDNCIGCEACFDVCPVSVKSKFHLGLGSKKAVHIQFPGSVPSAAVVDKESCLHFGDGSCKDVCVQNCPFESFDFDQKEEKIEISVGAIVLATGFDLPQASTLSHLGYGRLDNIYTFAEFERLVSSNGPSGGKVKLKNGAEPATVAVIHCAGSLNDSGISYCSGICCTNATKVGEMIRKQTPGAKVFNFHKNLVFSGPSEHRFFEHQKKSGTEFFECSDPNLIGIEKNGEKLQLNGAGIKSLSVDMVVLSTGILPSSSNEKFANMLDIPLDEYGFFKASHPLLQETATALDGVYMAGCAAGPCNVATSVTRGQSAVGSAISRLIPGREIDLEIMTSTINEEKCGACKLCLSVCPYKAVSFDAEKQICVINEVICRGCGTCTASCPSGASKARHFTDEQIYAEIGGVLNG